MFHTDYGPSITDICPKCHAQGSIVTVWSIGDSAIQTQWRCLTSHIWYSEGRLCEQSYQHRYITPEQLQGLECDSPVITPTLFYSHQ